MSSRQKVSRDEFLANVRQSGLLTDTQLAQVESKLPDNSRGRVAARAFVQWGLLTKFQAERILIGRTSGFQLGQYRILDQLGHGGMGRVFKAKHRTMDRTVALKVLAPTVMQSGRAQELFLREVRAAAQLNHPNIVAAYDANETDGRLYLVLEFVEGQNLEQLVRDRGPLPVGQACDFIFQAALGLQCAAERGMVHRDIKPANLLVQRGGIDGKSPDVVKVSDFGLARLQAPDAPVGVDAAAGTILTRDNTVMGTPDYLSPEQARNLHKADIRSDLYSLGCTFYYLLTGRVPFPGGKVMDKLIRHGTEKPQPVAELRPDVPPAVAAVVARLLAKHPKQRYQTPAELVEVLTPFAVTGSTPLVPVAPATPADLDGSDETPNYKTASDPELEASTELSALANTATSGLSPTPPNAAPTRAAPPATKKGYSAVFTVIAAIGLLLGMGLAAAILTLLTLVR